MVRLRATEAVLAENSTIDRPSCPATWVADVSTDVAAVNDELRGIPSRLDRFADVQRPISDRDEEDKRFVQR
jgi:hypothetical protein